MPRRPVVGLLLCAACATTAPSTTNAPAPVAPEPGPSLVVKRWSPLPPPAPLEAAQRTWPVVTRTQLRNGLSVVVVEHHARPLVRVRLVFPSGASSDEASQAGATAFALGLLTMTRDVSDGDGQQDYDEKSIRKRAVELGGLLRFRVLPDAAWLGVDGYAKDTRAYLSLLNEAVRHPRHGEDSFLALLAGARDVVDEQQLTDPEVLERSVTQLAFGDERLGTVTGTAESLSRIGVEEVTVRQAALVHPQGATLVVVGDVQPAAIRTLLEGSLATWRPGGTPTRAKPVRAMPTTRRSVTFLPRQNARTTTLCAARALGDTRADERVLAVMAEALSRRLSSQLREERGLAYTATGALAKRLEGRALLLCARVASASTLPALERLLGLLGSAQTDGFSDDELDAARQTVASTLDRAAGDLDQVTAGWVEAVSLRRPLDLEGASAAARAVSNAEVREASKTLDPRQFQLVLAGDRSHIEPAVKALKLGALRTPVLTRVED